MADLELLSLEDVPPNSFLLIRVDVPGPMEKYIAAQALAKALAPSQNLLRDKHISVMVLTPKEEIMIMTEQEMNAAGWFRK